MKMIAAVDKNWAIGNKGVLLAHLSGDMKFFRAKTTGNTVILGRKTLATFPGGNPLKDRRNIVLTHKADFDGNGAEVANSVEEVLELVKNENTDNVYVIGGESVYSQFMDYCDTAYITVFDKTFEADVHIENLDMSDKWQLKDESEDYEEKGISYCFRTYVKK